MAVTSELRDIWLNEINDEGLIAGEAWKHLANRSRTQPPTVWEGGLAVPYEFDITPTLEIGQETWASLSLPEHFLTTRNAQLTWWKKAAGATTWTNPVSNPVTIATDAEGRLAFPVKTATGTTAPLFNGSGDLSNAVPGEVWQARIAIPQTNASGGTWFTCYSPHVTIVPGPPDSLTVETAIPTGNASWVADNRTETPVTVLVKDKKGNPVADGTEVSMDLYGTASTRPVHGSEAPLAEGQEPDPHQPLFLTQNGRVTLTFRTFLTTSATAYIRSGHAEKELTIQYRGVQGTLSSSQTTLNTNGTGNTTTATLSLTTPVANGTPVVWTVNRYKPGGIPLANGLKGFDQANFTVEGTVAGNTATLPINATGAPTGLCVVTATVAQKIFYHTLVFSGGVSFSANLDREVLMTDQAYATGGARDFTRNPADYGGEPGSVTLSTGSIGSIQGVAGRTYQVRFTDPYGPSGLRLSASASSAPLPSGDTLNITANAAGQASFFVRSSGQASLNQTSCVRIEVRDVTNGHLSLLQISAAPTGILTTALDAAGAFLGISDPQTGWGVASCVAGGFCAVGDVGALSKNICRAAGVTSGEFDYFESGLAGIGVTTSLGMVAGGATFPMETAVSTLRGIRGIAPRLFRVLASEMKQWKAAGGGVLRSWHLIKYLGIQLTKGAEGITRIKALDLCFSNQQALDAYHVLGESLGDHSLLVLTAAIDAVPTAGKAIQVVRLMASLKPDTLVDLAKASSAEIETYAAGLAKLLDLVPVGRAKPLDMGQLQRIFDNKNLFRHPIPGKSSTYSQTDILKELSTVASHTDGDGVMRLVKALKSGSERVSGNRYALSVVSDLIENGSVTNTTVVFINKYAGRRGGTDLDVWCTVDGIPKILEIKSTRKAFGDANSHASWLEKVRTGWNGPLPKIEYRSPLPDDKIPGWLENLSNLANSGISYVTSIPFK